MSKPVFILVLIMLAGCDEVGKQERLPQMEAHPWNNTAMEHERARREFWQGLACFAGAWSVVLLIIGVAMGSATIPKEKGGPDASNP